VNINIQKQPKPFEAVGRRTPTLTILS